MITAFCFTHNSITKGEPIVESITQIESYVNQVLVVDMESTDITRDVLRNLNVDILTSTNNVNQAFMLHEQAKFDQILLFYPNEIYDILLLDEIKDLLSIGGIRDISVLKLVIEQNFQRIRWYPEPVHRVFKKGTVELKDNTTNKTHLKRLVHIDDNKGYLWSCQNCFLDNVLNNKVDRLVPAHFIKDNHFDEQRIKTSIHWRKKNTPIKIPNILKPLVGKRIYTPY